ncbi:Aste57867_4213 [Aphanomyces stellatus]|uniref:Aste57867_4213 protein n=2 Tax=Aphanomyces stellatus TaxID=120398 RepID=A0A485KF37_9STRA|nr:hypothetical protein As57867_004202 [Aphanomyces stellatus]VFT81331.1 Aste57867_4213 [Aphanomyces stellatus]
MATTNPSTDLVSTYDCIASPTKTSKYNADDALHRVKHPCVLGWNNVSYVVHPTKKERKQILHNVSGRVAPGELLAILGPSGSGKTTLLDILADRISSGQVTGDISVNGIPRQAASFRLMASYVAQEDSLLGSFTVLETLRYSAQLSVAASVSADEREARVQAAIDDMGLRSCTNTVVGDIFRKGLSGGQKRRLSIAIELLKSPTMLLLDEPTSGLDSASTMHVLSYILKLAGQGRSVVCTIHQPSSAVFDLFTNVMLLAQGHTVYFGSPRHALDHFASLGHPVPAFTNPSEHYLELINADFEAQPTAAVDFAAAFAASSDAKHVQDLLVYDHQASTSVAQDHVHMLRPSLAAQLRVILHRNSINNIRNPGVYGVRLVMYIFLSVMVGTMYLHSNKSLVEDDLVNLLFFVQAFLVFMSVAVLPFFIEQRAVFARERANNALHVGAYVAANFGAALPGIFVIALVSAGIVTSLAGLHAVGAFVLNLFLSLVVAESLMHVLGATSSHYILGIANAAGIFGMFMQVQGFMIPPPAMPSYWQWAHTLAFHSYSFETFVHQQFKAMDTPRAAQILARFDFVQDHTTRNMLILVGYALVLEVLFAAILYKWHTGRR